METVTRQRETGVRTGTLSPLREKNGRAIVWLLSELTRGETELVNVGKEIQEPLGMG